MSFYELDRFNREMDRWSQSLIGVTERYDPQSACAARVRLGDINRQFPNIMRTPQAGFTPLFPSRISAPGTPIFPRPPAAGTPRSSASGTPLFASRPAPAQTPRKAWTPMHSGGALPNQGVRQLPQGAPSATPFSSHCHCRNPGFCVCISASSSCHCGAAMRICYCTPVPASNNGSKCGGNGGHTHEPPIFGTPFSSAPGRSPFALSNNPLPDPPRPSTLVRISPIPWITDAPGTPCAPTPIPWATGAPNTPSRTPTPGLQITSALNTPSRQSMPALPQNPPDLQQWNFPSGQLNWTPHPAPHPKIPATHWWTPQAVLQGVPTPQWQFQNTPLGATDAGFLTGGFPLPGAAPWWTPSTMPAQPAALGTIQLAPCLIPNPAGTNPLVKWDISTTPFKATYNELFGGRSVQQDFNENATSPPVNAIQIAIHDSITQNVWGGIKVENADKVRVWDVLNAIYEYFQANVSLDEIAHFQSLNDANHAILLDAASRRCATTPGLPDWEHTRGIRRVDVLGDQRKFWGLWITNNGAEGWHLNLGLRRT